MRKWIAFAVTFGFIAVAVLAVRAQAGYVAFQDFGEWIYQGEVLAALTTGQAPGIAQFATHPVPNTTAQLLLGLNMLVLGAAIGPVVYLLLYAAAAAAAVEALVRRYSLPPVAASLVLSAAVTAGSGFWNGYVAAQWGLVLLMVYWSMPRRTAAAWPILIGFALLAFFTHGVSFGVWGLMALVRCWPNVVRLALASLPALSLVVWYLVASPEGTKFGGQHESVAAIVGYKAYTVAKLGGYQNVVARSTGDFETAPWLYWVGVLAIVGFGAFVVAGLVIVAWRLRVRAAKAPAAWVAVSLLVLALLMPPFLFGLVNPGERVLSSLGIMVTPWLLTHAPRMGRLSAVAAGIGLTLTLVSVALLGPKWGAGEAPTPSAPDDSRGTSLFAHRLDQMEDRVRLAEEGQITEPLVWTTSVLVRPT